MPFKLKMNKKGSPEFAEQAKRNAALQAEAFMAPGLEDILAKGKRRNGARILKPGDVPIGGYVHGIIKGVQASPVTTIKGKLLLLENKRQKEFCFPITGVIRQGIGENPEKEIGSAIVIRRLPDQMSAKYRKAMFMFDVFTLSSKDYGQWAARQD